MANHKPSVKTYSTQLFEALDAAKVPRLKAYTAVEEVREMAGQNMDSALAQMRAELKTEIVSNGSKIESLRWLLLTLLAVLTILTGLGIYDSVIRN